MRTQKLKRNERKRMEVLSLKMQGEKIQSKVNVSSKHKFHLLKVMLKTSILLFALSARVQDVNAQDIICENSSTFSFDQTTPDGTVRQRKCGWLRNKEEFRQDFCQMADIRNNCKITCGICCFDNPTYEMTIEGKARTKKCGWLAGNPGRISAYCNTYKNGLMVRNACPKSCEFCSPLVEIGPTLQPTEGFIPDQTNAPSMQTSTSLMPSSRPTLSNEQSANPSQQPSNEPSKLQTEPPSSIPTITPTKEQTSVPSKETKVQTMLPSIYILFDRTTQWALIQTNRAPDVRNRRAFYHANHLKLTARVITLLFQERRDTFIEVLDKKYGKTIYKFVVFWL